VRQGSGDAFREKGIVMLRRNRESVGAGWGPVACFGWKPMVLIATPESKWLKFPDPLITEGLRNLGALGN
jgi:hypothetical protein